MCIGMQKFFKNQPSNCNGTWVNFFPTETNWPSSYFVYNDSLITIWLDISFTNSLHKGFTFCLHKAQKWEHKNVKFKILGQDYKVYGKCLVYHLNILLCISQIYTLNLAASLSTNGVVIMSFYAVDILVLF